MYSATSVTLYISVPLTPDVICEWSPSSKNDLVSDQAVNIGMLAKMVASSAEPNWPLIVQLTLSREMAVARSIILHLGSYVPGGDHHTQGDDCCGGFQCSGAGLND